jgi:hypothetical protein
VRTVSVAAHGEAEVLALPEGILRVQSATSVEGWVYVTPWPSDVTGGNCRYEFEVPVGRYRLLGWRPYGGERSLVVRARETKHPPRSDLKFDSRRP